MDLRAGITNASKGKIGAVYTRLRTVPVPVN